MVQRGRGSKATSGRSGSGRIGSSKPWLHALRHNSARPGSGALTRWLVRNRRLLAALCFCLAAGLAVHQLTPDGGAQAQVVTTTEDLPAGRVLDGAAVTMTNVPPDIVPGHSFTAIEHVLGRQLAAPVRSGEILTDASVLGPGLLTGAPSGTVAVPLRVTDPSTVQLIRPGERVDVVISTGNGFEQPANSGTAASNVVVLWTSAGAAPGAGALSGTGGGWLNTDDAEGLVVVAARPAQAERLAGAATRGKVFLVLVGSG